MKCLLVDDEPGIREGLAALLRRRGHEVVTAGDVAAATARLDEQRFDVVITDWRLPDGTAAAFVAASRCPVIAVSGHPEEVLRLAAVREVLTKPVAPARLLEALAAAGPPAPPPPRSLPRDVQLLIDAAAACLGGQPPAIADDGVFVTLRAPLPDDALLDRLAALGGDLRVLAPGGRPCVELRWCRDGRPDLGVPVVAPAAAWPAHGEFAVDFDGWPIDPAAFAGCLDRAAAGRRAGVRVHFLNIPEPLQSWVASQGRAHDMPMRDPVGPRLPAVLADLWRSP